jgi:hypothetical protein
MICLASTSVAFAQGAVTGTLTGTVADSVGVIPGATITVTNLDTNTKVTGVSNDRGVFRVVSLAPGRYTARITMSGFKQVDIAKFPLRAGETRDLNRQVLAAGSAADLQKNPTGDCLPIVQAKGRDIFGMLKVLPGAVNANDLRDFALWSAGRSRIVR